jgi:ADP-ribose pyrophosphatase YjhB (NUDIX family)
VSDFVMNFCPRCGKPLADKLAYGKQRRACEACGFVVFRDPVVAVVALVVRDGKALMVRRAMHPQIGKWAFPAGYLDYGEDPRDAAVREVREETGIDIRITRLIEVLGPDHTTKAKASVVILFEGEALGGVLQAEDDVDRAAFLARDEIPLGEMAAFESVQTLLDAWNGRTA